MTISGLKPFLREKCPDAFFKMKVSDLAGKRVAIDASNYIFTTMAIARGRVIKQTDVSSVAIDTEAIRKHWFDMTFEFIFRWLRHGVTPVFVFDGEHPAEKEKTKEKRREVRAAASAKIDEKRKEMEELSPLDITPAMVGDLRKAMCNYNAVSYEEINLFYSVLFGAGIPVMTCKGDAERLCSLLVIQGKAAAVFSADSDCLAFGAPLIIEEFSRYSREPTVNCIRLDKVLAGVGLSFPSFVDFCIMCGCDYNDNMKGIARVGAMKIIKQWGSIDNLPATYQKDCLRHQRCRELFAPVPYQQLIEEDGYTFDMVNHLDTARTSLERVGAGNHMNSLVHFVRSLPPGEDGGIIKRKVTLNIVE